VLLLFSKRKTKQKAKYFIEMSTSSNSNQSQLNFGNTQQVAQQASIAKNYNHAINTINHNHFHNDLVEKQKNTNYAAKY